MDYSFYYKTRWWRSATVASITVWNPCFSIWKNTDRISYNREPRVSNSLRSTQIRWIERSSEQNKNKYVYSIYIYLNYKIPGLPCIWSKSTKKPSKILSRLPIIPTHENIYTVPNLLTFSRLAAAPLVGYFVIHDCHGIALSLLAYAGITDLIDGYIARTYSLQTVMGTIIDPIADKMLVTVSVVCLALNGSIPGKLFVDKKKKKKKKNKNKKKDWLTSGATKQPGWPSSF